MNNNSRFLSHLPAIYREDTSGDLHKMLEVFEEIMFGSDRPDAEGFFSIESQINAIPYIFSPLGADSAAPEKKTPDRFLPWLASWLGFTPHKFFESNQLRKIIAGIVPLYGRRGTRDFLEKILALCFDEIEPGRLEIDESPRVGLVVGSARIGEDSLLATAKPFFFRVAMTVRSDEDTALTANNKAIFKQRVAAIIDFAKPLHTSYELKVSYVPGFVEGKTESNL